MVTILPIKPTVGEKLLITGISEQVCWALRFPAKDSRNKASSIFFI
jgi:hypothetical protein